VGVGAVKVLLSANSPAAAAAYLAALGREVDEVRPDTLYGSVLYARDNDFQIIVCPESGMQESRDEAEGRIAQENNILIVHAHGADVNTELGDDYQPKYIISVSNHDGANNLGSYGNGLFCCIQGASQAEACGRLAGEMVRASETAVARPWNAENMKASLARAIYTETGQEWRKQDGYGVFTNFGNLRALFRPNEHAVEYPFCGAIGEVSQSTDINELRIETTPGGMLIHDGGNILTEGFDESDSHALELTGTSVNNNELRLSFSCWQEVVGAVDLIEVPESGDIRFYMKLDDTDTGHRLEVHCENSILGLFGYKALFECPYNSVISIELLISTYSDTLQVTASSGDIAGSFDIQSDLFDWSPGDIQQFVFEILAAQNAGMIHGDGNFSTTHIKDLALYVNDEPDYFLLLEWPDVSAGHIQTSYSLSNQLTLRKNLLVYTPRYAPLTNRKSETVIALYDSIPDLNYQPIESDIIAVFQDADAVRIPITAEMAGSKYVVVYNRFIFYATFPGEVSYFYSQAQEFNVKNYTINHNPKEIGMGRFNAQKLVFVTSGATGYTAADVYEVQEEGFNVKYEGQVLEVKGGDNVNPSMRIENGAAKEFRAVLMLATPAEYEQLIQNNPTENAPVVIGKKDVYVKTRAVLAGGTLGDEYHWLTKANIQPMFEQAFKNGEITFLPVVFQSTDESIYEITSTEPISLET
jgi:hypothetical protein